MKLLHDIWVSWTRSAANFHSIPEFHEWKRDDKITLLDNIPAIKVNPNTFDGIENSLQNLPKSLLDSAKGRAVQRIDSERIKIDTAFLITDGQNTLAVHTEGTNKPILKSRLIPRQERLLIDYCDNQEPVQYNEQNTQTPFYYDREMIGLTRKERELKAVLKDCLNDLEIENNTSKIKYFHKELFGSTPKHSNGANDLENIKANLAKGWTSEHVALLTLLSKTDKHIEDLVKTYQ